MGDSACFKVLAVTLSFPPSAVKNDVVIDNETLGYLADGVEMGQLLTALHQLTAEEDSRHPQTDQLCVRYQTVGQIL